MYFITDRNSETGKKFKLIEDKSTVCFNNQKAFAAKYQVVAWRGKMGCSHGGISSVQFEENVVVDKKIWRNVYGKNNEYYPDKRTKEGRRIHQEIERLPVVTHKELNAVIGLNLPLGAIGVNATLEYFGFKVGEKTMDMLVGSLPDDCEEITRTAYRKLFETPKPKMSAN